MLAAAPSPSGWDQWQFGHPGAWPFLLLAPLVWLGLLALLRRRRARVMAYGAESPSDQATSPIRCASRWTLIALLGFGVWIEPRYGQEPVPVARRGLDLIFCLDVSRSMLAKDVSPSRLERAKRDLLAALPELVGGDRVALIAFAGEARLIAPLTHDLGSIRFLCADVDTDTVRFGGSDLAAAVRKAMDLVDSGANSSTVCVLMTDGEDLTGAGRQAAREAADAGITLHTLGYGSTLGSKVTLEDGEGGESFLASKDGDEVVTNLDSDSLRDMAMASGGDYLRADAVALPVVELKRKRLDPMVERSYAATEQEVYKTRFQWLLGPLLLLIVLEIGLYGGRGGASSRRSQPRSSENTSS